MKKLLVLSLTLALLVGSSAAWAYSINDAVPDAVGVPTFETYGLNVYNYTPGINSGSISFDLFTNYPATGLVVGGWATEPADFFITENYYGNNYNWAIPLVSHDGFTAGTMYAVGSYNTSNFYDPAPGSYTYNQNIPVRIATLGNNYGYSSFAGSAVVWNDLTPPGSPDWMVSFAPGVYQDDPNGTWSYVWGTATCANDVLTGTSAVPLPPSVLLLGTGMLGLVGFGWRRRKSNV